MDILIVSDIHGRADLFRELLARNRGCDGVLFLGDGVRDIFPSDIEELRQRGKFFAGVRGNCDMFSLRGLEYDYSDELLLNLSEYNVIIMHGHLHGVKSGIERAAVYASKRGADILLFGHTHRPFEKYFPEGSEIEGYVLPRPLWVFNPGSLSSCEGRHSYGRLSIKKGGVLFSHGELK